MHPTRLKEIISLAVPIAILAILIPSIVKVYMTENQPAAYQGLYSKPITDGIYIRTEEIWVDPVSHSIKLHLYMRPLGRYAKFPKALPGSEGLFLRKQDYTLEKDVDLWVDSRRVTLKEGELVHPVGMSSFIPGPS